MDIAGGESADEDGLLGVIGATPPQFGEAEVRDVLRDAYGIDGELTPLLGERDQNVRVITGRGDSYVLKIASGAESGQITDLQIQALLHLARMDCGVPVPAIRPTLDGESSTHLSGDSGAHTVRLIGFLPGMPLADTDVDADIAREMGSSLARLGRGLADFSHEAERRVLLWDLQQAPRLRRIVAYIENSVLRNRVQRALDDYDANVRPRLASLRTQVIHNDANPANILVDDDAACGARRVTGIIDFGDLVRAPLINDVAIAASYLRAARGGTLERMLPFVTAYHEVTPLEECELTVLFDLVRARLAATVTILWWRLSARDPADPYRLAALSDESDAEDFLAALDDMGRAGFDRRVLHSLRD